MCNTNFESSLYFPLRVKTIIISAFWTLIFSEKVSVWFWVPRSSQQIFEITCCQNSSRSIQVRRYQAGESELLVLKSVNRKNSKRPKWTATSMSEQVSQRKDKFYNNHWNMKSYLISFFVSQLLSQPEI